MFRPFSDKENLSVESDNASSESHVVDKVHVTSVIHVVDAGQRLDVVSR